MKYTQTMLLDTMCLSSPWQRHDYRFYMCYVINNLLLISNINNRNEYRISNGMNWIWFLSNELCIFYALV